jgi:hypothetical protein
MKFLRVLVTPRGLLLAVLAFVVGVAMTPIGFSVEGFACGRLRDGSGGFSATSYTSSYAVRLSFAHYSYSSKERANEVFDRYVGEAVRVVETTPNLNKQGVPVGRRAVTISYNPETHQSYACVFWTDSSALHSIESPSLLHVIELEKGILGEWRLGLRRIQYLLAPDAL